MWALRRRVIIIAIIVGFFAVTVVLPYLYTHREIPTCYDQKQNQDESGVDCGGVCALQCPHLVKKLTFIWQKIFPVREGTYDIAAYVENPNFGIGIVELPYTARLYDSDGTVIAEKHGVTHVGSNERFHIFVGGLFVGERTPARGSIEFPGEPRWVRTPERTPPFDVVDKKLISPDAKPKLTATLKNLTTDTYRDIILTAVIYDKKNTPIAVSSTKVERLDPLSEEHIFFTWNHPLSYEADFEECEAPVDVMLLLDRSGSMASEGKNPPQPFARVREAASSFVDALNRVAQVGMVSFATTASLPIDLQLTSDFSRAKRRIESTQMGTDGIQYTNTGDALYRAGEELTSLRARADARKVVVLLTDGEAMEPNRPKVDGDPDYAKRYALEAAERLRSAEITIYTIGLGVNANEEFLKAISTSPEHYYASPSVADLKNVYQMIATALCKRAPSIMEIIPRVNMVKPIGL